MSGTVAYRLGIAMTSLISAAVALYLHLWKLGQLKLPPTACTVGGGCVKAQMSRFGWFLGVDVALIGAIGYTLVAIIALVGLARAWRASEWPTIALTVLIYAAVLFTLRLKYGEFVVLRTFCPWCAISTVAITIDAVLVTLDWRRLRARRPVGIEDVAAKL